MPRVLEAALAGDSDLTLSSPDSRRLSQISLVPESLRPETRIPQTQNPERGTRDLTLPGLKDFRLKKSSIQGHN